jgi:RecA/RadA recombinase
LQIEGNIQELKRIPTDLYSLDLALSSKDQLGIPAPAIVEITGRQGVGKSTLAYHLASQVNPKGRVVLCDMEGIDIGYVRNAFEQEGFDGTLKIIEAMDSKGKLRSHEDMLNELTDEFYNPEVSAGILDSIGAISPIFEVENDIEGGFGAKRASIVARFIRRFGKILYGMEQPRHLFVTNHIHEIIGGRGHQSAGGRGLEHAKIVSLYLYTSSAESIKSGDEVIADVVVGKCEKLRYGGKGRTFKFVTVAGHGVRKHLSALIDAVDLGIVTRGAVLKLGDKSLGYISAIVKADLDGDDAPFKEIHEALKARRDATGISELVTT